MSEITGRLENWTRQQVTKKEFIIWGDCYDDVHGRFLDGDRVHTSGILNRACKEGDVVKTRNSVYLLGIKAEDKLSQDV